MSQELKQRKILEEKRETDLCSIDSNSGKYSIGGNSLDNSIKSTTSSQPNSVSSMRRGNGGLSSRISMMCNSSAINSMNNNNHHNSNNKNVSHRSTIITATTTPTLPTDGILSATSTLTANIPPPTHSIAGRSRISISAGRNIVSV
jgi:hypothetical protein